jgi:uncharacterized membrane protein YhhN
LRIFNKLLVTLALAFGAINAGLAFAGQSDIEIYFVANAIVFLIITLLYTYFNPRARGALNAMSGVVFAGFLVVVAIKVLALLK